MPAHIVVHPVSANGASNQSPAVISWIDENTGDADSGQYDDQVVFTPMFSDNAAPTVVTKSVDQLAKGATTQLSVSQELAAGSWAVSVWRGGQEYPFASHMIIDPPSGGAAAPTPGPEPGPAPGPEPGPAPGPQPGEQSNTTQ